MVGEEEEGVGAEVVREEGMCAMEISGNAVPNGAGDVIPVPSDRALVEAASLSSYNAVVS